MQFTLFPIFSLLALASALPQGTPPIERCTEADVGKSCNSGEINGFFITGSCTSFPIRSDNSQFACVPLGTFLGGQPVEKV
ncbi:hypothetical protein DL95DRAFT_312625 [Leptodontidium sp. 2 PMI_412]|nr:hypothetical protein DL95DRAFT_312625 [Leptodontidium sp. 2 PMI_412]